MCGPVKKNRDACSSPDTQLGVVMRHMHIEDVQQLRHTAEIKATFFLEQSLGNWFSRMVSMARLWNSSDHRTVYLNQVHQHSTRNKQVRGNVLVGRISNGFSNSYILLISPNVFLSILSNNCSDTQGEDGERQRGKHRRLQVNHPAAAVQPGASNVFVGLP